MPRPADLDLENGPAQRSLPAVTPEGTEVSQQKQRVYKGRNNVTVSVFLSRSRLYLTCKLACKQALLGYGVNRKLVKLAGYISMFKLFHTDYSPL